MTTALDLRLQVIDLRVRLEHAAARAFDRVCLPATTGEQNMIAKRLLFLVGLVDVPDQPRVHRLARLGGHVYECSSDVLHVRSAGLDPSQALVTEWRAVVADIEDVLAQ